MNDTHTTNVMHYRKPGGRMTLRGIARELQVAPATVLGWSNRGVEGLLLPRRMIGSQWTYSIEEYEAWQSQVQARREKRLDLPAMKAEHRANRRELDEQTKRLAASLP